ncbi:arginase family protein [Anoxybacillus ayderensis]|uniref:arginase family protein n=1 Tax=Anoxybacillus ayderensis TaxID=265546 RepID=UPI00399C65AE
MKTEMKNRKFFIAIYIDFEEVKQSIDNNLPTYLTVDCDVFDPSIFLGVTYSFLGRWLYQDFLNIIHNILHNVNIIAVDFVEFNSQFDFGNVSISTLTSSILDILAIVGERHG